MYVSDVLDALAFGEFSQLSLGGDDDDHIDYEHYPKVITALNLALLEIHKRFDLRLKTFELQHTDGITKYNLTKDHAATDPNGNGDDVTYPKYILDTAENPFEEDMLVILEAKDEENKEYPINNLQADQEYVFSILQQDHRSLVIPFGLRLTTNIISFSYRAAPIKLATDLATPEIILVPAPDQFLEPVLNYIAYRQHAGRDTDSPEAINYYQKFEFGLKTIERMEGFNKTVAVRDSLTKNGFV